MVWPNLEPNSSGKERGTTSTTHCHSATSPRDNGLLSWTLGWRTASPHPWALSPSWSPRQKPHSHTSTRLCRALAGTVSKSPFSYLTKKCSQKAPSLTPPPINKSPPERLSSDAGLKEIPVDHSSLAFPHLLLLAASQKETARATHSVSQHLMSACCVPAVTGPSPGSP